MSKFISMSCAIPSTKVSSEPKGKGKSKKRITLQERFVRPGGGDFDMMPGNAEYELARERAGWGYRVVLRSPEASLGDPMPREDDVIALEECGEVVTTRGEEHFMGATEKTIGAAEVTGIAKGLTGAAAQAMSLALENGVSLKVMALLANIFS